MHAHLIRRLLTGSLYWVVYQMIFGTEIRRQEVKDELAINVPWLVSPLVNAMVIYSQLANLFGQGTGRMPLYEVIEQGIEDLRTLTALLWRSKTKYILSTVKPTVFDTDMYAFVSPLFYDATLSEMDWVVTIQDELPLLVQYIEHMRDLLFPELGEKKLKSS